jgi:hypothetical protein
MAPSQGCIGKMWQKFTDGSDIECDDTNSLRQALMWAIGLMHHASMKITMMVFDARTLNPPRTKKQEIRNKKLLTTSTGRT